MLLNRYVKQPAEIRRYTVDYSRFLEGTETLSSVITSVAIIDGAAAVQTTPLAVNSAIIDPDTATFLSVWIEAGHDGELGEITVTVTTSDGQVQESEIEIDVRED